MLVLRRYRPADQEAVRRLHVLALEAIGAHIGGGPWDAALGDIEGIYLTLRSEFLVGFAEHKLIAMGALRCVSEDTAEVKRMRVHPDYQGRGYGKQVLRHLEETARHLGYRKLVLDTSAAQVAAQHLYRKAGYVEVQRGTLEHLEVLFFEKSI